MRSDTVEAASLLLNARADANAKLDRSAFFRAAEMACRLKSRLSTDTPVMVRYMAECSSSALGHAIFHGSEHLVSFLLAARGDPELPNNRGHTPLQLTRHHGIFQILHRYVKNPKWERSDVLTSFGSYDGTDVQSSDEDCFFI
ncbi:unnamed protein product [Symbiodinium pilosum]|uniref:Uncharacterized protein n=1 Tax=Symbiodinium pilosum TaxID=2952 RepID=A0A812JLL2_SYMPI|nr:unnamed protein product [Symbiodinium pilosum]